MALAELSSRDAVIATIEEFNELGRDRFLTQYGYGPARIYVLDYQGHQYDSKAVAGVAYGKQFPNRGPLRSDDFSGGEETVRSVLEKLGFTVVMLNSRLEASAITGKDSISVGDTVRSNFEELLERLPEVRATKAYGQHEEIKALMKQISAGLTNLSALKAHPSVQVSWSLGAGNWAKIPWIALMDERETDTTQVGTYAVFLFPEDMSGVFLTLNQGVTKIINEHGRKRGRELLAERARSLREDLPDLVNSEFKLDSAVDLKTEGGLGQDYEASTIALYAKGAVPNDREVDADVSKLLDAYDRILTKSTPDKLDGTGFWIFQANPTRFDIDRALADSSDITWTVKQKALRAASGDKVFLWRSGRNAGIVGIGTITAPATDMVAPADQARFILDHENLDGPAPRVWLHVDRRVDPPLLRTQIAADPRLQDLMILRFAQFGTFAITESHARVLNEMLEEGRIEPSAPAIQNVWTYAPGRDAEFWNSFYEQGMMAIGWDELGDLSQYGSLDEITEALNTKYPSESRQTNNARTCYDFVHKLKPGDLVFAKRGRNLIVGHGVVTGEYQYISDRRNYTNVRRVNWQSRGEWPVSDTMAIKALTDVTGFTDFVKTLKLLVSKTPPVQQPSYTIDAFVQETKFSRETIERWLARLRRKRQIILQGPPGTGKTFVAERLARILVSDTTGIWDIVQFHPSYAYEDFMQGIRPKAVSGSLSYNVEPGRFLEFCERAANSDAPAVLIVDEINRANLSRVFGELACTRFR